MKDQPLTSSDNLKLLMFTMISTVTTLMIVGSIPALIIIFSVFMTKKNADFSHIDTASKFIKGVFLLGLIPATGASIYLLYEGVSRYGDGSGWDAKYYGNALEYAFFRQDFGISILIVAAICTYLLCVHYLFHMPLNRHANWVEINPIFFKGSKSTKAVKQREMDIIKGEKLKQYSVADELLKWAKLKEDGHISEEEFQEAREKLLKKH